VALGERTVAEQVDRFVGKLEQTDSWARSLRLRPSRRANVPGDAEFVQEGGDRARFLDHPEVLACNVLDQRELDGLPGIDRLSDDRRDRRCAGEL
jgi:hypothetical protein